MGIGGLPVGPQGPSEAGGAVDPFVPRGEAEVAVNVGDSTAMAELHSIASGSVCVHLCDSAKAAPAEPAVPASLIAQRPLATLVGLLLQTREHG